MTDQFDVSSRSSIAGSYQGSPRSGNAAPGQPNGPAVAGEGRKVEDGEAASGLASAQQAASLEQGELSGEELNEAVSELNELAQSIRRELRFSLDDDSGRAIIEVYDVTTEELIRQIPPEQVLNVLRHLKEFDSGLLQEKA